MELSLTKVSPSHTHSSCAKSSVNADHGYLYDDCAREIPKDNVLAARSSFMKPKKQQSRWSEIQSPIYVVAMLALVVFFMQLGVSLTDVPSTRLLEGFICNKYYHRSSGSLLPEEECRVSSVQGELNIVVMGAMIWGYLPGILMAIPYGAMADKRGRKSVFGLCVLGMVLFQLIWIVCAWNWWLWNIRFVWVASAALLVGGGESVAEAMVFAMVSDVASAESKAIYFQVEICAILLAETIAPFVASEMMRHSVWLPILLSPAIMTVGGLLVLAVPETLNLRPTLEASDDPSIPPNFSRRARKYTQTFDLSTPWSRFRDKISAISRILRVRDVKLLIPTASLTIPVATVTMDIVLRYIPARFSWTLAHTGMALGVRTGFNILVLLAILPAMAYALSRRQDNNSNNDLILARSSVVLLVVGQAIFAAADSTRIALLGLGVFTLGTGAPSLCRAALTRLVDGASVGRLYSILAVCEMVGYLASAVGFGALYQVGMMLGLAGDGTPRQDGNSSWLALVFYAAAVVYFWCGGMLWVVDVKGTDQNGSFDGGESVRSGRSASDGKTEYEMRVLADGRVTRKCPSLESVSVRI